MIAETHASVRSAGESPYASSEDFGRVFEESLDVLYQLSFLLTGDRKKAETCLVSGIEDCVRENRVFREWARVWAKRTIIQNAIREVRPRPSQPRPSTSANVSVHSQYLGGSGEHFPVDAVLGLEDFERFVFVMSVLERYSQHECALLLGCSISQVREASARALANLAGMQHPPSLSPANSQIHSGYVSK